MQNKRTLSIERSTSTAHRLLNYDGACGKVHGHNFAFDVDVVVSMDDCGEDNMPVDLKTISDKIDRIDHSILLNEDDELAKNLSSVFTFDGDPTCEVVAEWMAKEIMSIDAIESVDITVNETEKYGVSYSTDE